MKRTIFAFCLLLLSCKKNNTAFDAEIKKEAYKKQQVFKSIDESWVLVAEPFTPEVESKVLPWKEWHNFMAEIGNKPKSSLSAFQKKATILVKKSTSLNNNIPAEFNKPQIKSRITVLTSKIKSLDLFINLNQIPVKKVVALIDAINSDLSSLQFMIENINQRNAIPKEEGEDYIKMRDTTRAISIK